MIENDFHDKTFIKIDTPDSLDSPLELIIVQCANGYEYAMHNYDFNPTIENELNQFENIKVKPFPFKTLMCVTYQGVFDKKYCPMKMKVKNGGMKMDN